METELAKRIVGGLKEAGISFVSYLPETRLSEIVPVLREDPSFMVVPVANEAEAVSIAPQVPPWEEGRPRFIWKAAEFTLVAYNLLVSGSGSGFRCC